MKAFAFLFLTLLFLASCREQPETSYTDIRSLKGQDTEGLDPERLQRIDQMTLNKGVYNEVRLLSRTTVETMMVNQIGDHWEGGPSDFNLAFSVVNDDHGVAKGGLGGPGTFEWGGYFNTQYFADPGEQVIGILMKQTQGNAGDQTGWKFKQMVFAAIAD